MDSLLQEVLDRQGCQEGSAKGQEPWRADLEGSEGLQRQEDQQVPEDNSLGVQQPKPEA